MIERAKTILKTVFGYDGFISLQQDVIENVLSGKDTLAVMPTGGGKSLCYQIPALIFDGLTIVVSPLISLMKDQVEQLTELGVRVVLLNSSLPSHVYRRSVERLKRGEAKLLYVAPETLLKPGMLNLLCSISVSCLAIDEAHCISEWGPDFRPEYRQLARVRERLPEAVCIALTATATEKVRADIIGCLCFEESSGFVAGFDRENLFIRVVRKENSLRQVRDFLSRFPTESGIIYCLTRKQVDELCAALVSEGLSALPYHAGLTEAERERNQDLFVRDEARIIVATIAFGMGINKSNVRFVLHHDLPRSIESYYQEIGRAGRDGMRAECLLLFSHGDIQKIKRFISSKEGLEKRAAWSQVNSIMQFAEADVCRRIPLLGYFGETYSGKRCGMCDNCLADDRETKDLTIPAQKFLSCIKRTGERFGANHIIDVLRGSKSARVFKFGHEILTTYGIGLEYSKKQWQQLARQLIHKGLVMQNLDVGCLSLTANAWAVMKGKESFFGILDICTDEQGKGEEASPLHHDGISHDRELFELLRKKRKELADEAGIPPFVIFSDRTLAEMCTYFPQCPDGMLKVSGIGAAKLDKYGSVFIGQIRDYCEPRGIAERPRDPSSLSKNRSPVRSIRQVLIAQGFNSGGTVESLSEQFNIKQERVLHYLWLNLRDGGALRAKGLLPLITVSKPRMERAMRAFGELGGELLKPVFDALDGDIPYDQLRIIGLYYLALKTRDVGSQVVTEGVAQLRRFVCLANSRKYSGRCIAGKELAPEGIGGWIRVVSGSGTGELTIKEITMQNGRPPELLDLIALYTGAGAAHRYQSENLLAGDTLWLWHGKMSPSILRRLCDEPEHLWTNGYSSANGLNDRIPLHLADETLASTLLFISVEGLCIVVGEDARGLQRTWVEFTYHRTNYRLAVTDPVIENRYMQMDIGRYPVEDSETYLTVSVSEPFDGFCYKLAAAIITVSTST
ncbi:MAG: DNA helicase RecQ [Syntrophobacteraceae bacterium]